jgi:diaminopimelate epimerase
MIDKTISFTKMQGAGNDFIVIEARVGLNYRSLAKKICDRTFGIGADGLLVLNKSKKADYRMHIINADGSLAEMCGNGARCLSAYIARYKKLKQKYLSIETLAGIIKAKAVEETAIVQLNEPKDYHSDIPLRVSERDIRVHFINTGVPHTIVYVTDLPNVDVFTIGRAIRYHEQFSPAGTNVNFVEQLGPALVAVRTYERGVENETRACGTGSVASAIVSFLKGNPEITHRRKNQIKVLTQSGETLKVIFDLNNGQVQNVWLKGSAKFIAQGIYYV